MSKQDIIVIGTSAGGVKALAQLAHGLPAGLPATIFVVSHMSPLSMNALPDIVSRAGRLLARSAQDGEPAYPGHMYLAPPDRHLLLEPGKMRLTRGARENLHRPAIDPLFRSAAQVYGRRVIGVILTGSHHDGVAGLLAIRGAGGTAIIQDPSDAEAPWLPQAALEIAGANHVVPVDKLAALLVDLVHRPPAMKGEKAMAEVDPLEKLQKVMAEDMAAQASGQRRGAVATFTCPECGGNLWQVDEAALIRFSCHVGHAYDAEDLLAEQSLNLEAALWTAVRTFKEKTVLARQLAARQKERGHAESAERFAEEARLCEQYTTVIQQYLLSRRESIDGLSAGHESGRSTLGAGPPPGSTG